MICGVDEAGKGAVIGPMVIAAVGCRRQSDLAALGVRDSKLLSPSRRELIYEKIAASFPFSVVSISAPEIDAMRLSRGMNTIVAEAHAAVIADLAPECAIVDACDVNAARYGAMVANCLPTPCRIVAEHRADERHACVGAASIIAKVTRDRAVAALRDEYGAIGSGYPSDAATTAFLRAFVAEHQRPPACARASWKTVTALCTAASQRTLGDFTEG
ncbi:MAG: ribonuclease HII [Methanomicrobiales archaeon]|nr:ribonuclease HII [Methanomicrobiales archaeon]